jgi:alpha-galactosidase
MTSTQAQSQFSMWAMVAAPLILGSDPRSLSSTSIRMLENPRVIAIDRDPLGAQGWRLSRTTARRQVWVRPLAGGARAVALFNRGRSAQWIATTATAAGLPNARHYALLNVWTNRTSTTYGTIRARVQPDAAVLYRVTAG